MFRITHALLALAALCTCVPAGAAAAADRNKHPVILVHGFLGFGPDTFEHSGFNYWGGYGDIASHMQVYRGPRTVFAAVVGPISSNWDRAADLYAQIKGGCVDYGAAHVRKYGLPGQQQKPAGKCWAADPKNNPENYPLALYPAWDAEHPVHFIGHSQGGTTIRALIELLEHGSPDDEGGHELFKGGKVGWVRSVTTISTPHNGTTFADAVLNVQPPLQPPLAQWITELLKHRWANWELSPDGAREFNLWARTSPHIYYYSVGTQATEAGSWCCNETDRVIAPIQTTVYQYPRLDMIPAFKGMAGEWIVPSVLQHGLGGYTQGGAGRVRIDSDWFANDGVVNTTSMRAPNGHPVRNYDGKSVKGTWNFLGNYKGYDHFDILNWPNPGPSANPVYERISDIIFDLPP